MRKRAFEDSTMRHVCIDINWRGEICFYLYDGDCNYSGLSACLLSLS